MSDKLLERTAAALEGIHQHLGTLVQHIQKGGAAPANKPAAAASGAASGAAANKPATNKPAASGATANKPGTAPAGGKPPRKAPNGTYDEAQVRDLIRQVATHPALGKAEATNILSEEANVKMVSEVKVEDFDKVAEACRVELAKVNGGAAQSEGGDEFDPLG